MRRISRLDPLTDAHVVARGARFCQRANPLLAAG
jgi:hypothetical protein